jgi:ubiquinone/menaquinone biosynthesis C-methylase UbiE
MDFWDRRLFDGCRQWACERASGDVLEVAIGTGRNLPYYPEDVRLTGVDWSAAMLDIARQRAARPVDLHNGDAQHLEFKDGSFDTVVCVLGLCAIPDDQKALTEMARVLKSGGRLLLVDHVVATGRALRAVQWLYERVSVPLDGEHFRRRPILHVRELGLTIDETHRRKRGVVELVSALKPALKPARKASVTPPAPPP